MYDEKKVGKRALTTDDIRKGPTALIRDQNAVPFDPNAGWKTGDLIPEYVLNKEGAKGSGADNKNVKGVWKDGMWTVVWVRPLKLTNPDDKALSEGKVYNFSFAVHDDNITTRGHHGSLSGHGRIRRQGSDGSNQAQMSVGLKPRPVCQPSYSSVSDSEARPSST